MMHSTNSGAPIGIDAKGRPTLIGIAFGLFSAALMFTFDAMIAHTAARQLWAYTYQTTEGTVLSNEITRVHGKGGSSSFELNATYSYRIGKDEYLGHVTPAKWQSKWNFAPTDERSCDDRIVTTTSDASVSPAAAAIVAAGVTAFFGVFLIGFAEELTDPPFSFSIVGWCAVFVVAAAVYFKVRQSQTRLRISAPYC